MNEDAAIEKMSVLPDSRPKVARQVIKIGYMNWVPIYCANCGADGGRVPESNMDFAFYLCDPCAEKFPNFEGLYVEPMCVYWDKVKRAQIEKYGRVLTAEEALAQLDDPESMLSKLAKDRKNYAITY